MKVRLKVLLPPGLLALVAAWFLWPTATHRPPVAPPPAPPTPTLATTAPATRNNTIPAPATATAGRSAASTNREFFRLSNTTKTIGELTDTPHAILLENALVDTDAGLDLNIPKHLRATGEPGAYIVQARGPVDAAFRALLHSVGAQEVSYIPNNALLEQLSTDAVNTLKSHPLVQAVLPFQPYFKVQSSLLGLAIGQKPLPRVG
jgi:hypothetical protein